MVKIRYRGAGSLRLRMGEALKRARIAKSEFVRRRHVVQATKYHQKMGKFQQQQVTLGKQLAIQMQKSQIRAMKAKMRRIRMTKYRPMIKKFRQLRRKF